MAIRAEQERVAHDLRTRLGSAEYPCLGARSVVHRDRATVRLFDELGSERAAGELLAELKAFAEGSDAEAGFVSFLASFSSPAVESELQFERLLWRQLQLIHDLDDQAWDPSVSSDPADPDFAISLGGVGYFVVGLHPLASRHARRAELPTLVFNLHSQFESLRAAGHYERMRDAIRARDKQLNGSVNPMVGDHGRTANACQYSGRVVAVDWEAPFQCRGKGKAA